MVEICRAFKNADAGIEQRVALIESSTVHTNSQVQIIQQIQADPDDDFKIIQIRLYDALITKLKDVINKLERVSDRIRDGNGLPLLSVKKGKYIFATQHLDSAIDEIARWQTRFDPTWKPVMLRSDGASIDRLLRRRKVAGGKHEPDPSLMKATRVLRRLVQNGQSSGAGVSLPKNELVDFMAQYIRYSTAMVYLQPAFRGYILETVEQSRPPVSDSWIEELAKDVRNLAEKLQFVDSPKIGIIQCKGFVKHESSGFHLVFWQPQNTKWGRPPRCLRAMLIENIEHSLSERMAVIKKLARAVSYMRSLGLVHKNIRPETILGFWISNQSVTLESVFLTGLRHFRAEHGPTEDLVEDGWEKDQYRHPDRQGVHPEEEYTMQHDIYSLGVCLLEIGIWTSFVSYDTKEKPIRGEGLKQLFKYSELLSPKDLKTLLVIMARHRLPSTMGNKYCQIIINCLTCLDGNNADFADESQLQNEIGVQLGLKYIEKVRQIL